MAKVLVLEDEQVLADAYDLVLTKLGHKVTVFTNAQDAVKIIKSKSFDALLVDMLMPYMNGVDFLKVLRSEKVKIPLIIAFSNIENPEVMNAAKKLGAKHYLLKVDYTPHQIGDFISSELKKK